MAAQRVAYVFPKLPHTLPLRVGLSHARVEIPKQDHLPTARVEKRVFLQGGECCCVTGRKVASGWEVNVAYVQRWSPHSPLDPHPEAVCACGIRQTNRHVPPFRDAVVNEKTQPKTLSRLAPLVSVPGVNTVPKHNPRPRLSWLLNSRNVHLFICECEQQFCALF